MRGKTGKDVVKRCRVGEIAGLSAVAANVADVLDSVPRGPTRDVKPVGRPSCKNGGKSARTPRRTGCNNRAGHTSVRENSRMDRLGAGPRTLPRRAVESSGVASALRRVEPVWQVAAWWGARPGESAADSGGSVPGAGPSPVHWSASAGSPGVAAIVWPSPGKLDCNNEPGDGWAERTVRTL
jgi:hypothetical protein